MDRSVSNRIDSGFADYDAGPDLGPLMVLASKVLPEYIHANLFVNSAFVMQLPSLVVARDCMLTIPKIFSIQTSTGINLPAPDRLAN